MTRGIEEVIVRDDLYKKLHSGRKLRVKFGIDPTGSELHIGHAVPLRKLQQFQELGHRVILLIGDFTAKIGDPTGRNETRPILTDKQIRQNMKTYVAQAGRVLDIKQTEIRYNSEWFGKKKADFMMELASLITVPRILERDDFQKRLKEEDADLQLKEILYPLMQGYDSVALKADVEIGGTDQKFNLLMGRKIQKRYGQAEQDIVSLPILEGLDGEKKMSKSYGNYIALTDTPEDMFGKVMSVPDTMIIKYFELCTDEPFDTIRSYEQAMKSGANPRDIKLALAEALTRLYHGINGVQKAKAHFATVIQSHNRPDDMPEIKPSAYDILTALVEAGFVKSRGQGRRDILGGGVRVNDGKISDPTVLVRPGDVVQKGKRFFVKIA